MKIILPKDNSLRLSIIFPLTLGGLKNKAFIMLKDIFTKAFILAYFNLDKEIWVKIDIFNYIIVGVLL